MGTDQATEQSPSRVGAATFAAMPTEATERHRNRMLAMAWLEGECTTYIRSYVTVMDQLESQESLHLMVTIVNNLLARMKKFRQAAYPAAQALMREFGSKTMRKFVMAAAVDIALNERKAGEKVTEIPTAKETLAR